MVSPVRSALVVALASFALPARAADGLVVLDTVIDPPTLIHLGVQVLISDDDDRDATISLRHREVGGAWQDDLPLHRVRGDLVTGLAVPAQFAGTAFGLRPATDYELELHAVDPDGLDMTWTVDARTRPVPRADPQTPTVVAVADAAALADALSAAAPGHVITLADGTYAGPFAIDASGTADDPIVIRGASTDGTIVTGSGCPDCNALEVYGSFVHVERLTLAEANRGVRFQGQGAEGNVVRRTSIRDVNLGIGARDDQRDFYLCDNLLTGPLVWPQVYGDDGGEFANVDGIVVLGSGHVVCHNELIGWGDAIKTSQDGARAIDFYGNLTRSAYDNAIELDASAGNTRAVGNLLINSWSPLSFQPIYGGPAYALRNVIVNVADEQHKLHSNLDTGETVGSLILHNTFVSPRRAVNHHASATAHDFTLINNLYVGPAAPEGGRTVEFETPLDAVRIDSNGYHPDGAFLYGDDEWPDFAAMQAAGVFETNGHLLTAATFASGLAAPADYTVEVPTPDAALEPTSPAVDAAVPLPGVAFAGAGPDLGALELGCPAPHFGVRPEGVDEDDPPPACGDEPDPTTTGDETTGDPTGTLTDGPSAPSTDPPPTSSLDAGDTDSGDVPTSTTASPTSSPTGDTGDTTGTTTGQTDDGGCACRTTSPPPGLLLLALLLRRRRTPPR